MFSRVGHLDLKHIGWLFSIWWLAYLVAELPSGVLADYWSHKKVVAIGSLARAIGFMLWIMWPTFTGYAVGFALWGVMIACSSGATYAYLHSELRADGKGHLFARYYGLISSVQYGGMLAGFFLAALLTLQHTNTLIGLSAAASFAGAIILLLAAERPYSKQATYIKTLRSALHEFRQSKKLRYLCYGSFTILMVIGVLEELLPRLYADFGLNDSQVSLMVAAALLATIFLLTKLESFVRFSLSKQMLVMGGGILVLIAGLISGGTGAAFLILLFSLVFQLFRPVFQHHILQEVKGEERATVGSIPGFASGIFGAVAFSIIGWVAQAKSERFSIGAYAFFWFIVITLLAIIGRRYKIPYTKAHENRRISE
jgi:MFS family permease